MGCEYEKGCLENIKAAKDGDVVTCWGDIKHCPLQIDLAPGVLIKESLSVELERLLKRVGVNIAPDNFHVYPIPHQYNIRVLDIIANHGRYSVSAPFDCREDLTEEDVLDRLVANCAAQSKKWLFDLIERMNKKETNHDKAWGVEKDAGQVDEA